MKISWGALSKMPGTEPGKMWQHGPGNVALYQMSGYSGEHSWMPSYRSASFTALATAMSAMLYWTYRRELVSRRRGHRRRPSESWNTVKWEALLEKNLSGKGKLRWWDLNPWSNVKMPHEEEAGGSAGTRCLGTWFPMSYLCKCGWFYHTTSTNHMFKTAVITPVRKLC